MEIEERCQPRKCLKEINPEEFPGVYLGIPGKYDPDYGACVDCEREYIRGGRIPEVGRFWHPQVSPTSMSECNTELQIPKLIKRMKPTIMISTPKYETQTLFEICQLEEEIAVLENQIQEEGG